MEIARTGENLHIIRTNIYHEDVFLYILPNDDLKSTYKQILYTALERSPSASLLLRIIFFVETQRDTILLRDDIIRWLREMDRWLNIVSSYHGGLTTASCVHVLLSSLHCWVVTNIAHLGSYKETPNYMLDDRVRPWCKSCGS